MEPIELLICLLSDDVTPSSSDEKVCERAAQVLNEAKPCVELLDKYKDCSAQIRQALSLPSQATENEAMAAVKKNVVHISKFYNISKSIGKSRRGRQFFWYT